MSDPNKPKEIEPTETTKDGETIVNFETPFEKLPSEKSFIFEKFQSNETYRCPTCYMIPNLELHNLEKNIIVKSICSNKHEEKIELEKFIKNYKKSANELIICDENSEKQINESAPFVICPECKKYLCHQCSENHELKTHKKFIHVENLDNYCFDHNSQFNVYCLACKKNYCIYCKHKVDKHKLINLSDIMLKNEEIENYKKKITENENYIKFYEDRTNEIINTFNNMINNLKNSFNKFKDLNEKLNTFIKDLIEGYENAENNYEICYEIINNLRNVKFNDKKIFNKDKINYELIFNQIKFFEDGRNLILFTEELSSQIKKEQEKQMKELATKKANAFGFYLLIKFQIKF